MNFIFISPNFPIRYYLWVKALRAKGMNVLCVGDTPYASLTPELRESATEYYWLKDLNNYEDVLNACRFFEKKYGHID
ncbi:MAG: carbamoylphosphate synthase large subunit, partial [Bacilli bacterium]|nr:carbamoylphosphate synthase large subunit [Bacilli bacterium]